MTIQQWLGPNGLLYSAEDEEEKVNIFWGGRLYYSFNRNDMLAKKIGIALFTDLGVHRKDICDFFKISRRTITNILAIYQREGFDGLKNYKPGPTAIEDGLKQFVTKKYIELEGLSLAGTELPISLSLPAERSVPVEPADAERPVPARTPQTLDNLKKQALS